MLKGNNDNFFSVSTFIYLCFFFFWGWEGFAGWYEPSQSKKEKKKIDQDAVLNPHFITI